MDRAEYFEQLRMTSDFVKPLIQETVASHCHRNDGMYRAIFSLVSERTKKSSLLLKPLLVRLAYEACGGRHWTTIAPICAAAELMNISSYQANLSFDGKFKQRTPEAKTGQFIASMITREGASELIHHALKDLDANRCEAVLYRMALSNKHIYIGQYYDLVILGARSLDSLNDFDEYLKLYLFRCESLSGVFSSQCAAIGALLAGADLPRLAALEQFGKSFGTGLHITNDIADFASPESVPVGSLKEGCDQFSDIRRGKLTLPIAYAIRYGAASLSEEVLKAFGQPDLTACVLHSISRTLQKAGAFGFAKRLAKRQLRDAKFALHELPDSRARSMLSVMASQIRTNKYIAALRSAAQ